MSNTTGEKSYLAAYERLNSAQRQAVDTIEGPVMVVAGPGTGKTQILTLRIANILRQTDTSPDSILALTFTESGAKAMRERLVQYLGSAAYQVNITTFHAFAGGLIGQYPDAYPVIVGGQAATDIDRIKLIESILESEQVTTLRPAGNPQYYVRPLLQMISDLKRENITPDRLAKRIAEQESALNEVEQFHTKGAHKGKERGEYKDAVKHLERNRALMVVYRAYEAGLRSARLYDFDDMIGETVRALEENDDMLSDLQEQYQYLLADEHQDVNGAQNRILELLASYHNRPNIFVVGDEKQAIFRFQGASLENFLFFESRFADTVAISLKDNYRSGQPILDAAHDLIKVEAGPLAALRVPLSAVAQTESSVTTQTFPHQVIEDQYVVEAVKAEIEAGTPPSEIAVIVRSNREVEDMAAHLRSAAIPVTASAEGDVLNHPITRQIESLLRSIGLQDQRAVFEVLHAPYWNIAPGDIARVTAATSYQQNLVDILTNDAKLKAAGVADLTAITNCVSVLREAHKRSQTDAPHMVLAWLLEASLCKASVLETSPHEAARVVRRLYDEIEGLVRREQQTTIPAVLESLSLRRAYGLPLNAPFIASESDAVAVMTAHKSKGLEFAVVFAPHLVDSAWGSKRQRSLFQVPLQSAAGEPDQLDDEKRLLYVLMTRAKRRLELLQSEQNADGRPLSPSRLLGEIADSLLEQKSVAADTFNPVATIGVNKAPAVIDTAVAAELFAQRGFSATSLNNYLQSPYQYYFRNLLRIPEVQTLPLLYGTAVHEVLRRVVTEQQAGGAASDSLILSWIEQALKKLPLTTTDYTRLHEQATNTVLPYVAAIRPQLPPKAKMEFSIKVNLETGLPELPSIPLTGNLDRIDFTDAGQALRVVDYKTGKPKSRNVIAGKTANSDGGYKRQLVFYALLLELYDDERYRCRTGVLSFVESATGTLKEEVFEITDEEVAEVREAIITATQSIINGTWVDLPCDPACCDYCYLLKSTS